LQAQGVGEGQTSLSSDVLDVVADQLVTNLRNQLPNVADFQENIQKLSKQSQGPFGWGGLDVSEAAEKRRKEIKKQAINSLDNLIKKARSGLLGSIKVRGEDRTLTEEQANDIAERLENKKEELKQELESTYVAP
jgi:transposase